MTAATHLRVACVGAGYFAQFHYDSWARMDRVDLIGACDRDLEKAQATGLPAFTDLGQMLDDLTPDLLDIILPPVAHADAIRTALAAGIKWIICQKPFCRDLAEGQAIVAEAQAAGATNVVHENFRFNRGTAPSKQRLKQASSVMCTRLPFGCVLVMAKGQTPILTGNPISKRCPAFWCMKPGSIGLIPSGISWAIPRQSMPTFAK